MLDIMINKIAAMIIKKTPTKVKTLSSTGYLLADFTNFRYNLEERKYEAKAVTVRMTTPKKVSIRSFYGL